MAISAYSYITLTGTIIPDTAEILFQVENEYKQLFGQDLVTTPNTPQGKLITAEVLGRSSVSINNATLANQINPNIAGGIYLDAIGLLTNSKRRANTYSQIQGVLLTGIAGTNIPQGSIAKVNSSNAEFSLDNSVELDISGNAIGSFTAVMPGEIAASVNTLTIIASGSPLGWETVNNPNAATLGSLYQSDELFRTFRRNTLASWGSATLFAISSALYNTPGVKSLQRLENRDIETQVIEGITLIGKSVWFCVDGGDDEDIANSILGKASGGCGFNGAISIDIEDPLSGSISVVKFDRPTEIPILTRITVKVPSSVVNPVAVVKSAVLAYANGQIGDIPGLKVGTSVSPFEISSAIVHEAPAMYVQKVEVAYASGGGYQTIELPIEINEKATITESSIIVVILT